MSAGGVTTALGSARARFMEGLPRRSRELRAAISLVAASPQDPRPREELRRRLHALYASAQVFQQQSLASVVTAGITRLDTARDEARGVTDEDLEALVQVVTGLSSYGQSSASQQDLPSTSPGTVSAVRAPRNTPAYGTPVTDEIRERLSQPPGAQGRKRPGSDTIPRMMAVDASGQPRAEGQSTTERPPAIADPSGTPLPQAIEPPRRSGTLPNVPNVPDVPDVPVVLSETLSGQTHAPALSILVIDGEDVQADVRGALEEDRFEVSGTANRDEALAMLRNVSPDVVLIDRAIAGLPGADLVRQLHDDPMTDVRAVFLLQNAAGVGATERLSLLGADRAIDKPIGAESLNSALSALMFARPARSSPLDGLLEGTAEDIASRVAEEIRTGVTDSLQMGRNEKIRLQDAAELKAAAWGAIGRIRNHLAHQADGKVRFRDAPRDGEPAVLALTDMDTERSHAEVVRSIEGRRILVADDDPAVLWFFGGLLREAGAHVLEARDGKEALELARLRTPHVVISDILMPKIDGFALCRELKRDLILADVPVILLSWKEDFLQRMRELEAGASGYLRKEAGSETVLACIGDVLRPRARLEAQLDGGHEVRGRVEGLGVLALLESVALRWGNARLTIRDTMNLFDVDIRKGNTLAVTRTATDGAFGRGEPALLQLLGVRSGRFTVVPAEGAVRGAMDQPLDQLLAAAARRLGALLDAVSDTRLMQVARVAFDDEILAPLLTATPTPVANVVERLRNGETVRDMVNQGAFPPDEIEAHLRELARHGAIERVFDEQGQDLVAAAMGARDERPGALMHSSYPPRPVSEPPFQLGEEDVDWLEEQAPDEEGEVFPTAATLDEPELMAQGAVADDSDRHGFDAPSGLQAEVTREPSIIVADDPEPPSSPAALPPAQQVAAYSAPAPAPSRRAPPRQESGGLGFVLSLAAALAVGYYGWLNLHFADPEPTVTTTALSVEAHDHAPGPAGPNPSPPAAARQAPAAEAPDDSVGFGRVLPFIDRSRGVEVSEEQGLLVVEFGGEGDPPRVQVGEEDLGSAPAAVALPAGRHELMIGRGQESSFRYLVIRPGETRIVEIR